MGKVRQKFKPGAIRKAFPTVVAKFEHDFDIDTIFDAIKESGYDEEDAEEVLSELLKERNTAAVVNDILVPELIPEAAHALTSSTTTTAPATTTIAAAAASATTETTTKLTLTSDDEMTLPEENFASDTDLPFDTVTSPSTHPSISMQTLEKPTEAQESNSDPDPEPVRKVATRPAVASRSGKKPSPSSKDNGAVSSKPKASTGTLDRFLTKTPIHVQRLSVASGSGSSSPSSPEAGVADQKKPSGAKKLVDDMETSTLRPKRSSVSTPLSPVTNVRQSSSFEIVIPRRTVPSKRPVNREKVTPQVITIDSSSDDEAESGFHSAPSSPIVSAQDTVLTESGASGRPMDMVVQEIDELDISPKVVTAKPTSRQQRLMESESDEDDKLKDPSSTTVLATLTKVNKKLSVAHRGPTTQPSVVPSTPSSISAEDDEDLGDFIMPKDGSSKNKKRQSTLESGPSAKKIKTKKATPEVVYFKLKPGYLDESENMVIIGEEYMDADDADNGDVPVRSLEQFVVYDINDNNRIQFLELCGEDDVELRVSGKVRRVLANTDGDLDDNGEEDEDDIDDDMSEGALDQWVNLTTIFHWEMEMVENGQSVIWLRTQFAFYKLGVPAPEYATFYEPLFKKVRIANKAMSSLATNPRLTYKQLITSLENGEQASSSSTMGSGSKPLSVEEARLDWDVPITEADVKTHVDYILQELSDWVEETMDSNDIVVPVDAPIIQHLNMIKNQEEKMTKGRASRVRPMDIPDTDAHRTTRAIITPSKKAVASNKIVESTPCVTPLIATLAGSLFNRELKVSDHGLSPSLATHAAALKNRPTKEKDITNITQWVGDCIGSRVQNRRTRSYYEKAKVDGEVLQVHDCVYVRNDEVEPWIGMIMYFFEAAGEMHYHVRYFATGAETVLMETAGWRELFLLDDCFDATLDTIIGKCEVTRLRAIDEVVPDDHYFYRMWYDNSLHAFESASLHESMAESHGDGIAIRKAASPLEACSACEANLAKMSKTEASRFPISSAVANENKKSSRYDSDDSGSGSEGEKGAIIKTVLGFTCRNIDYHLYDFVYLLACKSEGARLVKVKLDSNAVPLDIVQIVEITSRAGLEPTVKVQVLERADAYLPTNEPIKGLSNRIQKPVYSDCRKLLLTDVVKSLESLDLLEGTCMVLDKDTIKSMGYATLDDYKDQRDCYYFEERKRGTNVVLSHVLHRLHATPQLVAASKKDVSQCSICHEQHILKKSRIESLVKPGGRKLRALDIFSGCGGLSSGLKKTGIVETKFAIEFMPSAALTYKKNFPQATVFNDCANLLLDRAITKHAKKQEPPAKLDFSNTPLVDMPAPGEIDLIYCGPPCQGFSRMNQYQMGNEVKNSLIATSLSYVDFYKPEFFLLENVRGMMQYRLGGERAVKGGALSGGIKMGVVKFVLRCLTAMGYQTRFGLMQAGQHGLPQSRRRLFIWGARIGSSLPDFPLPSTCFSKSDSLSITVPLAKNPTFTYQGRRQYQAPDPKITVRDAITDLPGFEYVDPHLHYQETATDRRDRLREERLSERFRRRMLRGPEDDDSEDENMEVEEEDESMDVDDTVADPERAVFMQIDTKGVNNALPVGFTEDYPANYLTVPQSEFQRKIRGGNRRVSNDGPLPSMELNSYQTIQNHTIRKFNKENIERICKVKMTPESDHHSLPQNLKPWCLSSPDSAASRHNNWKGLFGRLDYDGHFQTAVTEMQPMGKQGKVIHPNQRRVISVRESARSQGFPDEFEFHSMKGEIKCAYKQVGNAVPVPLATALGLKLREAVIKDEEIKAKKAARVDKGKRRA